MEILKAGCKKRAQGTGDTEITLRLYANELVKYPADIANSFVKDWMATQAFFPAICEITDWCQAKLTPRLDLLGKFDEIERQMREGPPAGKPKKPYQDDPAFVDATLLVHWVRDGRIANPDEFALVRDKLGSNGDQALAYVNSINGAGLAKFVSWLPWVESILSGKPPEKYVPPAVRALVNALDVTMRFPDHIAESRARIEVLQKRAGEDNAA